MCVIFRPELWDLLIVRAWLALLYDADSDGPVTVALHTVPLTPVSLALMPPAILPFTTPPVELLAISETGLLRAAVKWKSPSKEQAGPIPKAALEIAPSLAGVPVAVEEGTLPAATAVLLAHVIAVPCAFSVAGVEL